MKTLTKSQDRLGGAAGAEPNLSGRYEVKALGMVIHINLLPNAKRGPKRTSCVQSREGVESLSPPPL